MRYYNEVEVPVENLHADCFCPLGCSNKNSIECLKQQFVSHSSGGQGVKDKGSGRFGTW